MVAGQACKPQSHTSRGWGMVQCSEALTFLSPQTSSQLSLVRPSSTNDLLLQTPRVNISCLHKPLGMTSRLSSYLGYDELPFQLLQQGQVQRTPSLQEHSNWVECVINACITLQTVPSSTFLVCTSLLAWLHDFQVILDTMNYRFSFFNKVGCKEHLLSRNNLIELSASLMPV
jgi:hypothetical protein